VRTVRRRQFYARHPHQPSVAYPRGAWLNLHVSFAEWLIEFLPVLLPKKRAYLCVLPCVCLLGAPAVAHGPQGSHAETTPVGVRLAAQNTLFNEQYQDDLKLSPESETARGDYRDNSLLDDYSLAASTKQNALDRSYHTMLATISTEGFPEQDRLSHELLLYVLDDRIASYELKNYEMPISQMQGIHNHLADLPNRVPLDTVEHYQDYIARLRQIPRAFEQTIDVLRQGEKDGLMPPGILLAQIPAQCDGTITENPFLVPTKKFPASMSAEDAAGDAGCRCPRKDRR
jgi:uncharacterized protein (DUF885 family)